jgi:prevent-host-death family protein
LQFSAFGVRLGLAKTLEGAAMTTVNMFEAKTQLSKYVEMAEKGQDVVIARAGRPVARLTQLEPEKRHVHFGLMKGRMSVADDFDGPLREDVLAEFEGR